MRAAKLWLLILGLAAAAGASAEVPAPNMTSFAKLLTAPGIGSVFLKYDYVGEPILAPASLTVRVFCDGEAGPRRDIILPMCSLDEHEFSKDTGELLLRITQGYVQGASVKCKIQKQEEYTLAKICRHAKK